MWTLVSKGPGRFLLKGAHGYNLQENREHKVGMSRNEKKWETWRITPHSCRGRNGYLIRGHHGHHLQATPNGSCHMSKNTEAWELWIMERVPDMPGPRPQPPLLPGARAPMMPQPQPVMPGGSWKATSQNARMEGGFLVANLRRADGQWNYNQRIMVQPGMMLGNQNGQFVIEGPMPAAGGRPGLLPGRIAQNVVLPHLPQMVSSNIRGNNNEGVQNVLKNGRAKYCCPANGQRVEMTFTFNKELHLHELLVRSANDCPRRDPQSITVYADVGGRWQLVSQWEPIQQFRGRHHTEKFQTGQGSAHRAARFMVCINRNHGDRFVQVEHIGFRGTTAPMYGSMC